MSEHLNTDQSQLTKCFALVACFACCGLGVSIPANNAARVAKLAFFTSFQVGWPNSFQVGWPPRFKLVGLKNFSWPFGFFWPHLKLAGLKNCIWPFFTLKLVPMKENIAIPYFSATHLQML